MSGWGGGYVTDVNYTLGWYRQQSPAMIALASIIGGASATIPAGDDPVQLLELGCGLGYGAMAQAASNPSWTVTAVDFNPAHIATAREWAAEAGLTNITFLEADLSRWEDHPALHTLPEMDFVTLHGVWSWVPPAAQNGIVRLLGQKVRPGGLVHVSYNTLPGWQDRIGLARIIREAGRLVPGRSDTRARAGLRVVQDLIGAGAHFTTGAAIADLVASLERSSAHYLAHEFMNTHWAPCFGMDVAAALSDAKLEWIATSTLTDNFPELMLTEEQREIFNRYSDPLMQELIKDMCVPRGLRHDVFVRGARRINLSERATALMDVHLTLMKPAEDLPDAIAMPAGRAELNREFYLPIVKALSARPGRVGDLLQLPELVGRRDNPAELISILIAADMAGPAARPTSAPGVEAMRFNAVTARRMMGREAPDRPVAAACKPTGYPVITPLLALALVEFVRAGITDLDGLMRAMNTTPEQQTDTRTSVEACLNRFLPVLKDAGVF
ncbi:MAG: class I SAM-dependent methyltransferase [Acetobacteraceae bacterium]|jgi:SAM-dependent methyltransferase